MTTSKEVFLSLLSMDAYNRGYGAGLGGFSDAEDSLMGKVKVVRASSSLENSPEVQAGFYAIAYEVTDGTAIEGFDTGDVVISYRGTDEELKDAWNGWSSIVGGVPEQARLAAQFYNSVREKLDEIAFCRLQHTI